MSWSCRHQENNNCNRLDKKCKPGQKGCVLESKIKVITINGSTETIKKKRRQ